MKPENKTSTSTANPNVLFSECLKLVAIADKCVAEAMRNRERVRRSLYRAAVKYQQLAQDHREWFLAQAEGVGGIDALLEGWFKSLSFFDEDWHDLLRDIAEGMSERQYMGSTAGSYYRRRRVAALVDPKSEESPLPVEPEPSLPAEERVMILQQQIQTLCQQLAAARKELPELRRIAARQERRIVELEGLLNRIEKTVSRRKAG